MRERDRRIREREEKKEGASHPRNLVPEPHLPLRRAATWYSSIHACLSCIMEYHAGLGYLSFSKREWKEKTGEGAKKEGFFSLVFEKGQPLQPCDGP